MHVWLFMIVELLHCCRFLSSGLIIWCQQLLHCLDNWCSFAFWLVLFYRKIGLTLFWTNTNVWENNQLISIANRRHSSTQTSFPFLHLPQQAQFNVKQADEYCFFSFFMNNCSRRNGHFVLFYTPGSFHQSSGCACVRHQRHKSGFVDET